jgi:prepilin-type N-terminal cleavage/methylation domain-containing protein
LPHYLTIRRRQAGPGQCPPDLPPDHSAELPSSRSRRGFTLIELILVMALIVIVVGVSFPMLQNFFRGRSVDSEVRRFLTLTRHGQSRAASEGIPMVLWVDARERTYGLQAEAGYLENDGKAVEYEIGEDLTLEVTLPPVTTLTSQRARTVLQAGNLPAIRFLPDGSVAETSPDSVRFEETRLGRDSSVWVAQAPTLHGYEIRHDQPFSNGRR